MAEKTFHSITLPGQDLARVPLTAAEFSSTTQYITGNYCTYQGKLYVCIKNYKGSTIPPSNSTYFTETNIGAEIDKKLVVPVAGSTAPSNPEVGDLWIDSNVNSPILDFDTTPIPNSVKAVTSNGIYNSI